MPRLPRKTAWQPAWTHSNRRCFPASPIDTTTPQEKPETRDETHGCRKTSISCETSTNFDICETSSNRLECHKVPRLPRKTTWQPAWTHSNRRCFPASPIDTATPQENQRLETTHVGAKKTRISCETSSNFDLFDTLSNRLECHKVPRLPHKMAWQPAWTHSNRRGFPASPIDTATPQEKPETRDETHGCRKTSISCETSTNFDICETSSNRLECHKVPRLPRKTTWQPAWTHSNRRCFPASPIDTATPQENQRLETTHVGAKNKQHFARDFLQFWYFRHVIKQVWNVTKCHACHAKRHDNLLGHIRIGDVFQLPP